MTSMHSETVDAVINGADASWTALRRDLEHLGRDIARLGGRQLSQGQDALADEIAKLRTSVSGLVERVAQHGEGQVDEVMDVIRRRPLTALAGVFAVGLVASALLSRRSA